MPQTRLESQAGLWHVIDLLEARAAAHYGAVTLTAFTLPAFTILVFG
jgi:hypothetical protein